MKTPMDLVNVPRRTRPPFAAIVRRVAMAVGLVTFIATVVRLGRSGYVDVANDDIGLLDAFYYASVTVTTTGYGDITAVSDGARLATILLITPARVLFLILVVSTTVEVLTDQTREYLQKRQWRQTVNNHTVICGFGQKGQAAAADLISRGIKPEQLLIVDQSQEAVATALAQDLVAIHGDATRRDVLTQATIEKATAVIVTPNRDDTAVLVTLTVRDLNPTCHIVATGREQENLHLLRQSGADEVIDAAAVLGQMLGLGTHAPAAVHVLDELLNAGEGLELVELLADTSKGFEAVPTGSTLVAVIRDGVRISADEMSKGAEKGDRLIVLRESQKD